MSWIYPVPTPTPHTVYKHKHTTKYHTQHTNKRVVLTSVKLMNCWQPLCCKAIWGIPPLVNSSGQTVFRSYQATTHLWLVGNSCKGLTAQWLSVVHLLYRGKYHLCYIFQFLLDGSPLAFCCALCGNRRCSFTTTVDIHALTSHTTHMTTQGGLADNFFLFSVHKYVHVQPCIPAGAHPHHTHIIPHGATHRRYYSHVRRAHEHTLPTYVPAAGVGEMLDWAGLKGAGTRVRRGEATAVKEYSRTSLYSAFWLQWGWTDADTQICTCACTHTHIHLCTYIPKPMHTHPSTTYVCLTAYIVTFCTCNVPTVHTCPLAYFITKSYVRVLASLWGADTEGLPAIPGGLFKGSDSISCVGLAWVAAKVNIIGSMQVWSST